jgi:hypothetical protein
MPEDLQVLDEEKQTLVFKNDTALLSRCTADFVNNFYPAYSIIPATVAELPKEDSLYLLNCFTFYRLCECMVDNIDELFPYFVAKMQKLFTTVYSIKQEVCYGIVSNNGKTALVVGVAPTSNDVAFRRIIEGLLPGMKIEEYTDKFENSKIISKGKDNGYDRERYVGCISGVPAGVS